MNSDLPQFFQPGPSTSKDESHSLTITNENIQFPSYHYEMNAAGPSTSTSQITYPLPLSTWPDSQNFPAYISMAVNATQPTSYIYPPTSSLRLPSTEQIPPNCLDWTINPTKAPPRQFKTTSEPLFALGYNSTISENWMEGDKGLQYSIKNFTFSTKRINNLNEACSSNQINEYDSLLISIPQVTILYIFHLVKNLYLFMVFYIHKIPLINLIICHIIIIFKIIFFLHRYLDYFL